jgi:hypothetical protein
MNDPFEITPPLGDVKPPTACGYGNGICIKPATWHIFWNVSLDNGAACDEHLETSRRWAWYTVHPMNEVCRSGGGCLVFLTEGGDSTCIDEDSAADLDASVALGEQRHVDLDSGRLIPVLLPSAPRR